MPRVIITDKLGSYAAAKAEVLPSVEHRQDKGLNNPAENSHQPFRRRERAMLRFRRMRTLQKFAAVHGSIVSVALWPFRLSRWLNDGLVAPRATA